MSCYLRIFGKDFDVDAFELCFPEGKYDFKKTKEAKHGKKVISLTVSTASMDAFSQQKEEAIHFLQENEQFFTILDGFDTEIKVFDFGVQFKEDRQFTKTFFFPSELITICGTYNIGIELSQYQ